MEHKIKESVFVFIFAILTLPQLQHSLGVITSGPLYGFVDIAPDTKFSWPGWWNGSFQQARNSFLNDNTGFRADLVRLNNQLDYSFFKKTNLTWVVIGKENCIYQDRYINHYYGKDFLGYDSILRKLSMAKLVQDTLARLGKSLIIAHAPCKVYYYPEFLPDRFMPGPRRTTNFETYIHIGDSLGIKQIDFNILFVAMKATSKQLLYPKQGIHWSVYGSLIAADTFVRYVEQIRNIRMPHPVWNNIVTTTEPRSTDNDIARMLNLIYPAANELFSYPEVHYSEDNTCVKPRAMYIGDSFLSTWMEDGLMDNCNTEWAAWVNYIYHSNIKDNKGLKTDNIDTYDWINGIKDMNCIVLLYTTRDLMRLGDGFIEKAYGFYFPNNAANL